MCQGPNGYYLITCSGSKFVPEIKVVGTLEQLSFHETLHIARKEILKQTKIDVNWNFTLPAWRLYSGSRARLYRRISEENWSKPCIEIRILSALFGWVRHTDLIPYYNLKMTDCILNRRIWMLWNDMNVLDSIVDTHDIDLLTQHYRKAINRNGDPVATAPDLLFTGYGDQQGIWLNKELSALEC